MVTVKLVQLNPDLIFSIFILDVSVYWLLVTSAHEADLHIRRNIVTSHVIQIITPSIMKGNFDLYVTKSLIRL